MKKVMIYVVAIVLVLMTTIGFATETVQKLFEETQSMLTKTEQDREELKKDDNRREKITALISETESWDDISKFDQMLYVLDATKENPIDYNNIIYNYEYLRQAYHFTQEELDYVSDMIIKGYDADDIIEICYFWTDTNEDIKIIEEIYLLKGTERGKTWIENAFNRVTKDKYGVLTEEDVEEYMKKGVSVDDILLANKLCRKGVLTIQEILDMYIYGKSFVEITAIINGEETKDISQDVLNQTKSVEAIQTEDERVLETDTLISASDISKIEKLAVIDGKSRGDYYKMKVGGENIDEILQKKEEEIKGNITRTIMDNKLYKTISEKDRTEYLERSERSEEK